MENVKEVAPVVGAVAKGAAVAAKAAAASGKAAAKGAAKGAKAAKDATKPVARKLTKRRNVKNPKYYDTDESGKKVFNQKRYDADKGQTPTKKGGGRPSNKITNSGKQTVDPDKNTEIKNQKSTGLPLDSKSRDIGKDVDPDSADKRKEKYDTKVKDKAQDLKNKVGDAANYARKKAKSAVSATSGAFGTSSFSKESKKITFKDYLNKL